jgi:hypothetical protein
MVSPLQMAIMAAALANGGKVPNPSLIQDTSSPAWAADLSSNGAFAVEIETVRRGLLENVNGSQRTGTKARSEKHAIAGITGTTQNWRRVENRKVAENSGWFVGFAPYDEPTLAFAIFVENVKSGGHDAAPIAKRIVDEVLALPADGTGQVGPVEVPLGKTAAKSIEELKELAREFREKAAQMEKAGVPPALVEPDLNSNPDDAKRWQWLQKLGDLQALPKGTQAVSSSLNGERFPRTSTFTFAAPREEVRAWLSGSRGYWRYNRGVQRILDLRPKGSTLGTSVSADMAAMSGATADWISGPAEGGLLSEWPPAGRVTAICSSANLRHCAVSVALDSGSLVRVTIEATANPSRILIAD